MLEPAQRLELGDLLEALIAVGELDEAEGVLDDVGGARGLARPGLGTRDPRPLSWRCCSPPAAISTALSQASSRRSPSMPAAPIRSTTRGRCSRSGERSAVRRSARAARATLEDALARFEQLGAPLWAEQTRAELARIGGRAPSNGELTEAESQNRRARRRRPDEPRGGGGALPHRPLRRDGADARLSQARRALPRRARAPACRKGLKYSMRTDHVTADHLVGREEELAAIVRLLDAPEELPSAVVLWGEAGIGKTSLWLAGVDAAAARGYRILSSRPSEAETKFSFAGLTDLLAYRRRRCLARAAADSAAGARGRIAAR